MFSHIRLLIFDLDFLVLDAVLLKQKALRQSLLSFADSISPHVRLPVAMDVEAGYLEHGHRWIHSLDVGLNDGELEELDNVYRTRELRLLKSGGGGIFRGLAEAIAKYRTGGLLTALGADATREYLMNVSDSHNMEALFGIALCTAEFGRHGADEMIDEIMCMAEVYPSETLALGTRPAFFRAARSQDVLTVGCGWGLQRHEGLAEADMQSPGLAEMNDAILRADQYHTRHGAGPKPI